MKDKQIIKLETKSLYKNAAQNCIDSFLAILEEEENFDKTTSNQEVLASLESLMIKLAEVEEEENNQEQLKIKDKSIFTGTVYLIHFDIPYHHASHYIGFTFKDPAQRLETHQAGKGARLLQVLNEKNIPYKIVRTWPNTDRNFERSLKNQKNAPRLCPICVAEKANPKKQIDILDKIAADYAGRQLPEQPSLPTTVNYPYLEMNPNYSAEQTLKEKFYEQKIERLKKLRDKYNKEDVPKKISK